MPESRLPIVRAVTTAYSDAWRVFSAMRTLILYTLLIILAVKVVEDLIPRHFWDGALLGETLDFALGLARSFCLTPILIAIHRFIILDEVSPGYQVDPSQPGFLPFFGWLVALSILGSTILWVQTALTAISVPVFVALAPTLLVLIVVVTVSIRLAILFPALAVGAHGAKPKNAIADSKGQVVYIFTIFLLTLLPMAALAVAVTLLLGPRVAIPGTPVAIVGLIAGAVIHTTVTTLSVVIISRLFQAFANRVSRAN